MTKVGIRDGLGASNEKRETRNWKLEIIVTLSPPHLVIPHDTGPVAALASAWRAAGGRTFFVGEEKGDISDLPPWVVLVGSRFSAERRAAITAWGCRLLVIDGAGDWPLHACQTHAAQGIDRAPPDLLLNPSLAADLLPYPFDAKPLLLLGTRYALAPPEFDAWREWHRPLPAMARKILVACGDSVAHATTRQVLRAIESLDIAGLQAKVLTAEADRPALMAWADLAISTPDSICPELAMMQLPALLIVADDNQQPLARQLERAGVAEILGWAETLTVPAIAEAILALCRDPDSRSAQGMAGRRLVDGGGARHAVAIMRALDEPLPNESLLLRPAVVDDLFQLWRQANEPSILRTSLRPEASSLDEFDDWLSRTLADPQCRLWVLEFHGLLAAQIRYDRKGPDWAEVCISVAAPLRRRGLGTRLLTATAETACRELGVSRLRAVVRAENRPSQETFRRAGFSLVESRPIEGIACHVLDLPKCVGWGKVESRG